MPDPINPSHEEFIDDIPQGPTKPTRSQADRLTKTLEGFAKQGSSQTRPPVPQEVPTAMGLFIDRAPVAPRTIPTQPQASKLLWDMRQITDSLNKLIIKYYDFGPIRQFTMAQKLALLQNLALEYSSTSREETQDDRDDKVKAMAQGFTGRPGTAQGAREELHRYEPVKPQRDAPLLGADDPTFRDIPIF